MLMLPPSILFKAFKQKERSVNLNKNTALENLASNMFYPDERAPGFSFQKIILVKIF